MEQEDIKERKTKLIQISLGAQTNSRVREMAAYSDSSVSGFMRELINERWLSFYKHTRGYFAGMKQENKEIAKRDADAALTRLNTMNDVDLTLHLIEIGFLEPVYTDKAGAQFFSEIRTDGATKERSLWALSTHPTNPEWGSKSQRMTWNELINALKKDKKL